MTQYRKGILETVPSFLKFFTTFPSIANLWGKMMNARKIESLDIGRLHVNCFSLWMQRLRSYLVDATFKCAPSNEFVIIQCLECKSLIIWIYMLSIDLPVSRRCSFAALQYHDEHNNSLSIFYRTVKQCMYIHIIKPCVPSHLYILNTV